MAVQEALKAIAGGLCGRSLGPLNPATTVGTLLPPKKIHGAAYGVSGALRAITRGAALPRRISMDKTD